MNKLNITSEEVLEIYYSFALNKPKNAASIPQDEWISSLSPLQKSKASNYVAAFFNGDFKLFDKNNNEKLSIRNALDSISDCVYFEKDGENYIALTSEDYGLKVFDEEGKLLSKVSDDLGEEFNGFSAIACNLVTKNFATCSKNFINNDNDHYPV